ncbi:ATP synthase F(0) complex subunit C2, mitochondrial [Zonotrichia leucophrys gambelii]|uniref:ATP synthase F(0) complex subunit C2, mitochondrial n=1 Tax=Zonotrichia leucophrys gambelii TaxID=257770 RepID=UPI00314091B0
MATRHSRRHGNSRDALRCAHLRSPAFPPEGARDLAPPTPLQAPPPPLRSESSRPAGGAPPYPGRACAHGEAATCPAEPGPCEGTGTEVAVPPRNPSLKQPLFSCTILGFALSEAVGLFCLTVAFLILLAMWQRHGRQ